METKLDYTMSFIDFWYTHGATAQELNAYGDGADMALYGLADEGVWPGSPWLIGCKGAA